MRRLADDLWQGKPAIVIGGGPSLTAWDWALLDRVPRAIAINRSFIDVPTAEVFVTEDERFIRRYSLRPEWREFRGVKVFSCPDEAYRPIIAECDPTVVIVPTREKAKGWSRSLCDGLSTSSNSAIPALNLADILGAGTIYLMGIDCRTDGPAISHYHQDYPRDWDVHNAQLESFRSDFTHWAAINLKHRRVVSVVNPACPTTLTCWPRITFDQFKLVLADDFKDVPAGVRS